MAASGYEIRPRHVTNDGVRRQYHVKDALSEEDLVVWLGDNIPDTIAGFPFSGFEASENDELLNEYEVEVSWGTDSPGQQEVGTSSYRFSYQAPSLQIKRSLATLSITGDSFFWFPDYPPDFQGAINVVDFGTEDQRTEGFQLQPPAEVFSIPYADVDAVIDGTYQALVRSLCGKVNSVAFYGAAAGEIMLVRASGERSKGLWNLDFGFGYIANAIDVPVGDVIVVPAKDGMDLLWVLEMKCKADAPPAIVNLPAAAYVERVWERADLNLLNLP